MGTPFIGQHDKAQVSTILFLSWFNTSLLLMLITWLVILTRAQ